MEDFFETKFKNKMCFAAFTRGYLLKVGLSITPFVCFVTVNWIMLQHISYLLTRIAKAFLLLIALLGNYHALLYIGLLNHFQNQAYKTICCAQRKEAENISTVRNYSETNVRNVYRILVNAKRVFHELKEINDIVNRHFGWCIVALCLQNSIDLIHTSFWIILNFKNPEVKFSLARKYFL